MYELYLHNKQIDHEMLDMIRMEDVYLDIFLTALRNGSMHVHLFDVLDGWWSGFVALLNNLNAPVCCLFLDMKNPYFALAFHPGNERSQLVHKHNFLECCRNTRIFIFNSRIIIDS